MKILITGSTSLDYPHLELVKEGIATALAHANLKPSDIKEVAVKPDLKIDEMAKLWASENKIPIKLMNARAYTHEARQKRNNFMGEYVDLNIAIWDGKSPGVKLMVDYCNWKKLRVLVYNIKDKTLKENQY